MSEGRSRGKVDKLLSVFVVPYSKEVSLVRGTQEGMGERMNASALQTCTRRYETARVTERTCLCRRRGRSHVAVRLAIQLNMTVLRSECTSVVPYSSNHEK